MLSISRRSASSTISGQVKVGLPVAFFRRRRNLVGRRRVEPVAARRGLEEDLAGGHGHGRQSGPRARRPPHPGVAAPVSSAGGIHRASADGPGERTPAPRTS
jgi:hypothetical protein